jgi:O-succinylhomoserine sulfhydrylase
MSRKDDRQRKETRVVSARRTAGPDREQTTPIFMTSSFSLENTEHGRQLYADERAGYLYTRFSNPNTDEFVEKMCLLEGAADGIALASGMSAIFTPLAALLTQGDHVLAGRSVFGSTHVILNSFLSKWGIEHTYGDVTDLDSWEGLVRPRTRLCLIETPSNPTLEIADLSMLASFCRRHGIVLLVDNVFATPAIQRPMDLGADLVMHSATKFIDGQGRAIGGVVLGKRRLIEEIRQFARHTGPTMSPFNAWIFSNSVDTLDLRVQRHSETALTVSKFLESRGDVHYVRYPHLSSHPQYEVARKQMRWGGGLIAFDVSGGLDRAQRLLDALKLCTLTTNLGDVRTIATHPATTTHSALSDAGRESVGIGPGLIRLSIGLEDASDIIEDLEQALDASSAEL